MALNNELIKKAFEKYYADNGNTATHIFVYSKEQSNISGRLFGEPKNAVYLNNIEYSEMYSRDSKHASNFKDVVFIGVGTHADVQLRKQYLK